MSASPLLHESRRAPAARSRTRAPKRERTSVKTESKNTSIGFVVGMAVWGVAVLAITYAVLVLSMNTQTAGIRKDLNIANTRAANVEMELSVVRNRLERLSIPTEVIRWADSNGFVISHAGTPAMQEERTEHGE